MRTLWWPVLAIGIALLAVFGFLLLYRTARPVAPSNGTGVLPAGDGGTKATELSSELDRRGTLSEVRQDPLGGKDEPLSAEVANFVAPKKAVRVSSDITTRIPVLRNDAEIREVTRIFLDGGDSESNRHEAAEMLLRTNVPGLVDSIASVLAKPEEQEVFRSYCIQYLWKRSKTAEEGELGRINELLDGALRDKGTPVRREALLALVRLKSETGKRTAVQWLLDSSEDAAKVRDLAIRCVSELDLREYIPEIRKYVRHPDPVIRIAAIVALSEWGDEDSRAVFTEAANSENPRLQNAGKLALRRLDAAQKAKEAAANGAKP